MNTLMIVEITVLNSIWQAALLATAVWCGLRYTPRMNAATRFAIWWATLIAVVMLPLVPLVTLRSAITEPARQAGSARSGQLEGQPEAVVMRPLATMDERQSAQWPLWVAGAWGTISLLRFGQILYGYCYLRGLKRRATVSADALPPIGRRTQLLLSEEIHSPIAVGFAHPAVILPNSLSATLTPQEMEHVLLHEAGHLARWDDWTKLLGRVLGAVMVLHPVALWILHRIELERETACDDWVVSQTHAPQDYARSLARVYQLRSARMTIRAELLVSGMFGGRSRLVHRIEGLLRLGREFASGPSYARVAASVAALLVISAAVAVSPIRVALAQTRPAFDVTTVRLSQSRPEDPGGWNANPAGSIGIMNLPLSEILRNAYRIGMQSPRMTGEPAWVHDTYYDIQGKAEFPAGMPLRELESRMFEMMRTLLAERFKLVVKRETVEMPAYGVVVAKGGLKLQKSHRTETECEQLPRVPECHAAGGGENRGLHAKGVSLREILGFIENWSDRPFVDETGVTGLYDVDTEAWVPLVPPPGVPLERFADRVPLSTLFEQSLGLKIEARRTQVERYVIEHIERPGEN